MRHFTPFTVMLLFAATAFAGPVDLQTAKETAATFLKTKSSVQGQKRVRSAAMPEALKAVGSDEAYFYIFNVGSDEGYVIVSGDDRTEAILGYADKGRFDSQQIPDNMRAWLQEYKRQLQWLELQEEEVAEAAVHRVPRRAQAKENISPLITSLWNQGDPYNQLCPMYYSGRRCVTGCVATAMAQVMRYHQCPDSTTAVIPAYSKKEFIDQDPIELEAVPQYTKFDWEHMLNTYQGTEAEEELEAVATLMSVAGRSVKMNYRDAEHNGSDAQAIDIPDALVRYFGYSPATHLEFRDDYLMDEWNDLIYAELVAGRPVIYSGAANDMGHSFVVDGYDGANRFHINWGWGGLADGSFLLSVVNPNTTAGIGASKTNDGYTLHQNAVIGAKKDEGEGLVNVVQLATDIVSVDGKKVTCSFNNTRTTEVAIFEVAIAYLTDDGFTVIQKASKLLSANMGVTATFTVNSLPDGDYRILPVSRKQGAAVWNTTLNSERTYVHGEVVNGQITLTLVKPQPVLKGSIEIDGTFQTNYEHQIKVTIENEGDEFNGEVFFFNSTNEGVLGKPVSSMGLTVRAEESQQINAYYTPQDTLTHYLYVATDKEGQDIIVQGQLKASGEGGPEIISNNVKLKLEAAFTPIDADQHYILGSDAKVNVRITNPSDTTCLAQVAVRLHEIYFDNEQNGTLHKVSTVTTPVRSFKRHSINNISFDQFGTLEENHEFYLEVQYTRGMAFVLDSIYEDHYYVQPVLKMYKADGTMLASVSPDTCVVAADITTVDLRQSRNTVAVKGGNPNTLYILNSIEDQPTLPEGLTRNIIRNAPGGMAADTIKLQDGFDFVPTLNFTAKNISYTRTFNRGYNSAKPGGWNTIILPFTVKAVELRRGDETIKLDWFRDADDTDKNFWVQEFKSDNGNKMTFKRAATMQKHHPYLIIVPQSEDGPNLVGVPVTFVGISGTVITPTYNSDISTTKFSMRGTRIYQQHTDIFALGTDGVRFERRDTAVQAFRAYFTPLRKVSYQYLTIDAEGDMDAIEQIAADREAIEDDAWYTLDGRRQVAPKHKGIYIRQGKKLLVK